MDVEPASQIYVLEESMAAHPFLVMREALRSGDASAVYQLLTAAGLPRVERPLPPTLAPLIFEACCSRSADCVELLLEREAALVNERDWRGATPLHIAALLGETGIAASLLAHGASISAVTREGFQPLHAAANAGRRAMLDLLLSRGAPADAPVANGGGATALILTCEAGHLHCAELLLKRAASINASDRQGTTPLLAALASGYEALALFLLQHGASPSARGGPEGRTALHWAAHWGFLPTMQQLLQAPGAEVDVEDAVQETPLLLAARRGFSPVLETLLAAKAAVDRPNAQGITALMASSFFDHEEGVRTLLAHGASVSALDANRRAALHFASMANAVRAARLLLQHAADAAAVDMAGATPLQLATEADAQQVLEVLRLAANS